MVGADVLGGPCTRGRSRVRSMGVSMGVPCARRAEDVAPYQITDDIANDPGTEVAPREISLRS